MRNSGRHFSVSEKLRCRERISMEELPGNLRTVTEEEAALGLFFLRGAGDIHLAAVTGVLGGGHRSRWPRSWAWGVKSCTCSSRNSGSFVLSASSAMCGEGRPRFCGDKARPPSSSLRGHDVVLHTVADHEGLGRRDAECGEAFGEQRENPRRWFGESVIAAEEAQPRVKVPQ